MESENVYGNKYIDNTIANIVLIWFDLYQSWWVLPEPVFNIKILSQVMEICTLNAVLKVKKDLPWLNRTIKNAIQKRDIIIVSYIEAWIV